MSNQGTTHTDRQEADRLFDAAAKLRATSDDPNDHALADAIEADAIDLAWPQTAHWVGSYSDAEAAIEAHRTEGWANKITLSTGKRSVEVEYVNLGWHAYGAFGVESGRAVADMGMQADGRQDAAEIARFAYAFLTGRN